MVKYTKKEVDMNKIKEELYDFTKDKDQILKPDIVIIDEKTEKKKEDQHDKKNNAK